MNPASSVRKLIPVQFQIFFQSKLSIVTQTHRGQLISYLKNRKGMKQLYIKWTNLLTSSMTVGSRSTKTALGTCFPTPVSLKKVLKLSSPPPAVLSDGMWPSGWIPGYRIHVGTVSHCMFRRKSIYPPDIILHSPM